MKPADMVVLITGATGGIGTALARSLLAAGARVLLTGRRHAPLAALAATEARGVVGAVVADVTRTADRAALVAAAALHGVNVLVNNAGVSCFGPLETLDEDRIAVALHTNLVAPILLTRALLPQLRSQRAARVLNVGSVLGRLGLPGYSVYSAAKFGLRGFSEALRRELAGTPVFVQYLGPRTTHTGFNDARVEAYNRATSARADTAERVAGAAVRLLVTQGAERFIGFPESLAVRVNGLAPHWLDRAFVSHAAALADASSAFHVEEWT
jgi:short-subunit dehydrogenase